MKREIEPPEFSNLLEVSLSGMYSEVQANRLSGRVFMKFAHIVTGAALLAGCREVLPTITTSPDNTQTPTSAEVTPAETATGPTATGPTATEVSPTFTEAPTDTETPTPTDTETPTPSETPQIPFENGPSREFSALYPAEWHNKWTGKVAGMDIPIIVGLAYDVVHDTKYPITPFIGVTITQGGADAVADAFLRASHYRYTKLMGNNVTYEQYLELLKQPTCGEVLMMITDDTGVRREAWINPRQGVSVLIGDNIDSKLGVKFYTGTKVFFGVDGQGRLLIATDLFKSGSFDPYYKNNIEIADDSFIYNNFTALNYFGSVKNSCMVSGDSLNACGVISATTEINDFWQQLRAREKTQLANGKNLDFDIVRP